MKHIIIFLIIMFSTSVANAQFTKAEMQVSGLTCSMCSLATQKQLQKLNFIDSIGTDLEHAMFILYFKKDKTVNAEEIKKKVEDAGFSVSLLKLYYLFNNYSISDHQHLVYQNNMYHIEKSNKQLLNGEIAMKVIDKGFVGDKEYTKYSKEKHDEHVVGNEKIADVNRVYHVIIP